MNNETIDVMMNHKSVRKYMKRQPGKKKLDMIFRAGQQAPFASQAYSVLLSRNSARNMFHAPWQFIICVDLHKFELIMKKRGWETVMNDLFLLILSMQDGAYMAQNMVIAGRSLGLGSCYLGYVPYMADSIAKQYKLPQRVFPFVGLTMGYPAEKEPVRPRYPKEFALIEGAYPEFSDKTIEKAIKQMDEGYLEQDYYRKLKARIKLPDSMKEKYTYDDYSWTEHISRKWGLWSDDLDELKTIMRHRGFRC